MKYNKIKTWKMFNESSNDVLQRAINKHHEENPEFKESNKDNNCLIFNFDESGIVDNEVFFVEDPSNFESYNQTVSLFMLVSNFTGNNCHTAFSYVPKSISGGLTPGKNIITDETLIRVVIERKQPLN